MVNEIDRTEVFMQSAINVMVLLDIFIILIYLIWNDIDRK